VKKTRRQSSSFFQPYWGNFALFFGCTYGNVLWGGQSYWQACLPTSQYGRSRFQFTVLPLVRPNKEPHEQFPKKSNSLLSYMAEISASWQQWLTVAFGVQLKVLQKRAFEKPSEGEQMNVLSIPIHDTLSSSSSSSPHHIKQVSTLLTV
jgi:hypothetical protein